MQERVHEILSWYVSENPGVRTNLARMLNHGRLGGTGKMVILPVDQGFEHGPARSFAPNPAGTAGVGDALRLGCCAVGFTIYPGSAHCTAMYEELRELAEEAKASGL